MKLITSCTELSITLTARPGAVLSNCIHEAIATAVDKQADVILIYNNRKYTVSYVAVYQQAVFKDWVPDKTGGS